ncbi:serine/threonine protein kinase [Streptomyces sp. TLI_55]|uniref:protein kinase n=1 Tax=Streptomyces sp. TLI_55 TaxID=1938861 RepID=UPI000BCA063F|nr:protein kinase [Streptomyces sp. TLI_55]SNX63444.1 serine/threonine protein kinase [Streptomyces sp. TLI_55]
MDDYAGRVLADRYRLPLPPSDEYELTETRAFDTYSGQEVLVRQVPLPEVVEAEVLDAEGLPDGFTARDPQGRGVRRGGATARTSTRRPTDPAVRRAVEAAQAAAAIPDHPRLDQVFDVFAEGGSLWIVSELVAARPLAALLAEKPLTPYRAAEVASDVLMALRVLHAHGWVHRNITARTVLVCDDGRVMLTGLAVGAAEEALCGYDPVPAPESDGGGVAGGVAGPPGVGGAGGAGGASGAGGGGRSGGDGRFGGDGRELGPQGAPGVRAVPGTFSGSGAVSAGPGGVGGSGPAGPASSLDPEAARRAAIEAREAGGLPGLGGETANGAGGSGAVARRAVEPTGGDVRAARAGAIAAYRAGARAAARVQEAQQNGHAALPGARPSPEEGPATAAGVDGGPTPPYGPGGGTQVAPGATRPGEAGWAVPTAGPLGGTVAPGRDEHRRSGATPPGQIVDPYGVRNDSWHGAAPAGGGGRALPGGSEGRTAALPSAGSVPSVPNPAPAPSRWDELAAAAPVPRGPATALAAERARQARMAVVGPVTERWAPEQAGPVHENWQLAAPIGPATDLWALGALLFRAVQGHAPYPEESTAELVQMVCAEPPAFAEECGPLRPVVESLLRQDPTERLDFEELRGWLRSLVRSAPEPEAGTYVVAAPPVEGNRLPIVRRRGELVRRRRAGLPATSAHGRHKRAKAARQEEASPRRLGRTLLLLVLLLMAGAIAYAMLFMPKSDSSDGAGGTDGTDRTGAAGEISDAPKQTASSEPRPEQTTPEADGGSGSAQPQSNDPDVADGFTLRSDTAGFRVAVADGWDRTPKNGRGQVVYSHGDFDLIVVPGRDSADEFGEDPMAYQREDERELQPYRDSSWASASGLKTISVGGRTMAEGQFTWTDSAGRELFVRNLAILVGGKYHVVQVRGPEAERDEVTRLFEQASATYEVTG